MRGRISIGIVLVCLVSGFIPTSSTESLESPRIKALFDHYHYTTADDWAQWFEDNYPGEFTATYLTGSLTYEGLKDYDIFITYLSWKRDLGPQPTRSEVEALEEYVRNGGGVLLMGDDPYWGMWTNEYCNILSEPYGILFNDDQLLDPTNYDISFVNPEDDIERYIVFHNMAEHPVMKDISRVWAQGTCSLIVNNPNAVAIVRGDGDTYSDRYAGFSSGSYPPAVVALEHGSGRIVFSGGAVTYGKNVYDNNAFIWNIIKWLAETRPPLMPSLSSLVIFGALALAVITVASMWMLRQRRRSRTIPISPVAERYCPFCNKKVKPEDVFCSHCKRELKKEEKEETIAPVIVRCPLCKNEIEENWVACPHCGTRLKDDTRIY